MAQNETPFTPKTIDQQVEDVEEALQFSGSDHPKTPDILVISALHHLYTADQQTHSASLQRVRQRLLLQSEAAPERFLHLHRLVDTPERPGERRSAPIRPTRWRVGVVSRTSVIAAALLISFLIGGLVAGLILVRLGTIEIAQPLGSGLEVRLQPACAVSGQQCAPDALALLPQDRPILEQRLALDALGGPSVVRLDSSNLIVVDLPALKQEQDTLGLLSQTGLLEILDTGFTGLTLNQPVPPGASYPVAFTGAQMDASSIQAIQDPVSNHAEILFEFKASARSAFASYTQSHIGEYLTITLDNIVLESAVIQSQITGQGAIGSGQTLAQAQHTAVLLRSGALPLPLTVVSVQTRA